MSIFPLISIAYSSQYAIPAFLYIFIDRLSKSLLVVNSFIKIQIGRIKCQDFLSDFVIMVNPIIFKWKNPPQKRSNHLLHA
jgi:hypothetical protein